MKNFIFISPNFPTNYWQFCRELRANGLRVLGIGDQAYDELSPELRASLHEYYLVNSLENYSEVYRAVAFFAYKYGRIDWLESNNEYWLEQDARLRTDFNIPSGFHTEDMPRCKYKSLMKACYKDAGVRTARYCMVDTPEGCRDFIGEVGYPVIAKPDNGVGASDTWKIEDEEGLMRFFAGRSEGVPYIMEEFIFATINSYDAIIDSHGEPIFETGEVTPLSLVDIVNNNTDSLYYMVKDLPDDVRRAGRATVRSFGVKSRFVHFEFFRLDQDMASMGRKGDVVALEVNMRPCGGFSPDMMNFANSVNVYKIWADMIAYDSSGVSAGPHYYCAFAGRRDGRDYVYDHDGVLARYAEHIKMTGRIPDALSGAMGNEMIIANFDTIEEVREYYTAVTATG